MSAGDAVTFNGATATTKASNSTVTTTTPGGRTITTAIDDQGRPTSISLPGLPAMTVSYDHGRVAGLTQGGRSLTFGYTGAFVDSVVDSLGRTLSLSRDAAGHVTGQSLPGQNFTIAPDADGNVTTISSPQAGGYSESASYTPVGLLSSYSVPAGPTSITYDVDRTPTGGTSPWGALSFDSKGRLTAVGQTTYSYDTDGNLTGITSADGSLSFGGAPAPTSMTWSGPVSGTLQIGRNGLFQATSFTVGGQEITRDIDADGVVTRAGALTIQRSDAGFVQGTTLTHEPTEPALADTYTPNDFGEPLHYTASVDANVVFDVAYTRDDGGRITSKTESILNPVTSQLETTSASYTYDDAGRLACVYHGGQLVAHHAYDAAGNRTGALTTCGNDTVVPQTTGVATVETASIGPQNRLDAATVLDVGGVEHQYTYTYDANGALATKTETFPNTQQPDSVTTYSYDLYGNLRTVDLPDGRHIQYLIDATNRRVGKVVQTTIDGVTTSTRVQGFLYQDAIRPIAELDANDQVTGVFIYGSKGNVPDYIQRGTTRYRLISDHLGSVRLVVNAATGVVEQRLDYDEWGNVIEDTNPGFQPFGFAGGLYDPDAKFVRFGARDYDAEIGRWTSRDPIGFGGADPTLYLFVLNDPVNRTDPTGTSASDFFVGIGDGATLCYTCAGRIGTPLEHQIDYTSTGWALGYWVGFAATAGIASQLGLAALPTALSGGLGTPQIPATRHGADQIASRAFSAADIALTKEGQLFLQRDGARVFLKEVSAGRFNLLVEGDRGVITVMKRVPWNRVAKIAQNYGWYSPWPR